MTVVPPVTFRKLLLVGFGNVPTVLPPVPVGSGLAAPASLTRIPPPELTARPLASVRVPTDVVPAPIDPLTETLPPRALVPRRVADGATETAPVIAALFPVTIRVPPLTAVGPVYRLAPDRSMTPGPDLVSPATPA